jgi:uroporphyrin-III C-methyltransferase
MKGKVFLVGAGPGDPELLTLKALKAIQNAEVVVYDRLISEPILALIPHGIPRFYAGKSCKEKAMTQEEIDALLVALAKEGKRVVRLKGGDPLLFGRGGEEALELAKHRIDFEIIPGITSAQGCAAYAGIPLTHRGLATGVRFITGHRVAAEDTTDPLDLNWQSLADGDTTLVVYMGLANLGIIANKLMAHGLPASTPAVAIKDGTMSTHQVIISDLTHIEALVADAKLEPPTLIIIGKVAALAETLRWFTPQDENIPLLQSQSRT